MTELTLVSVNGTVSRVPVGFLGTCPSVDVHERLGRLGEGTYGVVYRARGPKGVVALKRMRADREADGVPLATIREVSLLTKIARHKRQENIVQVKGIAVGPALDAMYLELEYCEHDLARLMDHVKEPWTPPQVKCLIEQLLEGVEYLHSQFIIHRDIKLSNLLLNKDGLLKIADFGLARTFAKPDRPMTPKVVTLWYRAPEVLLGTSDYTTAIDMWSVGCIFGEFILHRPLLPGNNELDQMRKICDLIGPPSKEIWPDYNDRGITYSTNRYNRISSTFGSWTGWTPQVKDLLNWILCYNPSERATAIQALKHEYFKERPARCTPGKLPTHPELREVKYVKDQPRE